MVILGIDPGLNATGYGAITIEGRRFQVRTAGDIRPPRSKPLAERLEFLHRALTELMIRQHPHTVVLEMVFTHERYINTAAKMGHARGIACLVAQQHHVPLVEYPPARVKQALTGHGAASKDQVARMVAQWVGGHDPSWSFDATDALALAIAHVHMARQQPLTSTTNRRALRIADCGLRQTSTTRSAIRHPTSEIPMGWNR